MSKYKEGIHSAKESYLEGTRELKKRFYCEACGEDFHETFRLNIRSWESEADATNYGGVVCGFCVLKLISVGMSTDKIKHMELYIKKVNP